MSGVRKALFISLSERYLLLALKLASFIVLARLLTPEDIGLYAVAAAVIGLAHVIRDFGVGSYLVQEEELTEQRIHTAFSITLLLGLILAAAAFAARELVAGFYHDPRLAPVIGVLAVNFLIIPFGSVALSLLRRDLVFGTLLKINLASATVGFACAAGLAWYGSGYWALVVSAVATTVVTSLLAVLLSPRRGKFGVSLREWRRVLGFSGRASIASAAFEMANTVNDLVVGRALGFHGLALLSRAQGVMNVFHRDIMGAVRNVAFPAFARASRANQDIDAQHSRAVVLITGIAWPFYGFLALYAAETLRLLFGPQWDGAAPAVPLMCAAGAVAAIGGLVQNLLMASGRVHLSLRAALINQGMRVAILLACALWFDTLMGFAVGIFLTYAFSQFTLMAVKRSAFGSLLPGALPGLGASLALALVSLLAPAGLQLALPRLPLALAPEWVAVIGGLLFLPGWLLGLALLRHPLYMDDMFRAPRLRIDRLLGRRTAAAAPSDMEKDQA